MARGPAPRWQPPLSNQIELFHGTTIDAAESIITNGVDLRFARPAADFGLGFYMTTWKRQAVKWARLQAITSERQGAIVRVVIARQAIAELHGLYFVRGSPLELAFWSFVQSCRAITDRDRAGHSCTEPDRQFYDVVIGPVAKDWNAREAYPDYDQMSFHTEKAITLINDSLRANSNSILTV